MRILIHSNAPWVNSGYGIQTRLLMEQFRKRGHTVGVSAFSGLGGGDIRWKGHQIMCSGQMAFGVDTLIPHIQRFEADLTITLMDFYKLEYLGPALTDHNIVAWLPIDCGPLSRRDLTVLTAANAVPVAMSLFGMHQLVAEGVSAPLYVPHAVDTTVFAPMEDRQTYRQELGLDDQFIIGLAAANKDSMRKAFAEQFRAFALFHKNHPESVLLVHSTPRNVGGLDLYEMAGDMEIAEHVRFTEQYVQDAGLMDDQMMRRWYSALDVLSLCSYAEGFGVPLIEAQACGTPVITTIGSAMQELSGPGWLVDADDFWNPVHRAWWRRPRVTAITKAYRDAYNLPTSEMAERRTRARAFALGYDVDTVATKYWEPILEQLEKENTS